MTVPSLADLPPRAINARDQALLTWLAAVKVAAEPQMARRFWPQTRPAAARRRLQQLAGQYRLLLPLAVEAGAMAAAGLDPGPVYELSPLGRDWLLKVAGAQPGYQSKPAQYRHDLLVAEVAVRLAEAARRRGPAWASDWFGEPAIRPFAPKGLLPDGLGLLRGPEGNAPLAFFLELDASRESHGRHSSQIGRKIAAYDQYAQDWKRRPGPAPTPHFPPVLLVTHGPDRLEHLAAALREHRRRPVAYALAQLEALLAAPDLAAAPVWRALPAGDRQPDRPDQPLLNAGSWLAPPPRSPANRTLPAPSVKPAARTPPQPAAPIHPKPPASTSSRPATPAQPVTPPPQPAAPPPRVVPLQPPPRPPVASFSTYGKIVWATILVSLAILMMLSRYETAIHRWVNATPTANPVGHLPIDQP